MKKLRIIILALLALTMASCKDELLQEQAEQQIPEEGLVEKSYEVSIEGSDSTKSTLSGNTPVWEVGDEVSVYDPIAKTGRTFTVNSIEGGKANISGQISEGDFAFSAVYPAECVSSWSSITEPVYAAPATQTIASGRVIASNALVSRAYSENTSECITFKNAVSLVQFKLDRADFETVALSLGDSKTYTVKMSEGTFGQGEVYYAAVDAGSYSGLNAVCTTEFDISYTKSSSKTLTAKVNGQTGLGVISNGTKHINYSATQTGTIEGMYGFLNHKDIDALSDETAKDLYDDLSGYVEDLYSEFLPSYGETATTFNYTYKSIDPDGKAVTQSAFLIYPSGNLKGIILASHTPITRNSDCPTNKLPYEAALCWKGYAVVVADYYGFGATKDRPQAYLDAEVTARGNIDALNAARQLLSDSGKGLGSQVINLGYSQGGHAAVATVKYASAHPEFGVAFTRTFAGGSPFDLEYTVDEFLTGNYPDATAYLLVSIVGFIENEHLDVKYSDVFQGSLAATIPEMVLSKEHSASDIVNQTGTDLTQILTSDFLGKTGNAYEKIFAEFGKNSLTTESWDASAGGGIFLYHSEEDDIIPYSNMEIMAAPLGSACSKTVELRELYDDSFGISYKFPLGGYKYWAITIAKEAIDMDTMGHLYGAIGFAGGVIINDWPN